MNNIEITVNTFDDFIKCEQWLFNVEPPVSNVEATIFCIEDSTSYFYKVAEEFNQLRFITNGEY